MNIGTDISTAKQFLEQQELVAIPTETVYGLAGNALNESAIVKIFEAKKRPAFDPLIVHTHSISEVSKYVRYLPKEAILLFEEFSPGPLTIILPKSNTIPDIVTSGNPTVGIRIPKHPLTLELLQQLDFPLAAPSANPFGYVSPTNAKHVANQLGNKISYILDGGDSNVGVESTIVKCENEKIEVLRLGGLEIEAIEETLGRKVDRIKTSSSNPQAPGMLSSHYNPGKKLILGDIQKEIEKYSGLSIGIISFHKSFEHPSIFKQIALSPNKDLSIAARKLFSSLREFDSDNIDIILSEEFPDTGLGKAINDRLKRAAATK